jgi:hypothetical protein
MQLEVGREESQIGLASAIEALDPGSNAFQILLRHRSRSISQSGSTVARIEGSLLSSPSPPLPK